MRQIIRDFIKICSETLPIIEPIYEFGAFQVKGRGVDANLRPYFKDKKYVGTDMREGVGVDLVLDLHNINLKSESVGTALVMDTIEHVEFIRQAINEVYRVLKENGILIMSSAMNFPIHNFPNDYWRFTPEAFKSLLKNFEMSFVNFKGKENFPHTIIGIGFKSKINIDNFIERFENWKLM